VVTAVVIITSFGAAVAAEVSGSCIAEVAVVCFAEALSAVFAEMFIVIGIFNAESVYTVGIVFTALNAQAAVLADVYDAEELRAFVTVMPVPIDAVYAVVTASTAFVYSYVTATFVAKSAVGTEFTVKAGSTFSAFFAKEFHRTV